MGYNWIGPNSPIQNIQATIQQEIVQPKITKGPPHLCQQLHQGVGKQIGTKDKSSHKQMPPKYRMTRNMSAVPSQVESRLTTPHQQQPNQTEGVNRMGAEPQPQPRVLMDNANVFIEVLLLLQHSQQQMMEEIRQLKTYKTKEKGSQHNPEHVADKKETPVGGVSQNAEQRFITMAEVIALLEQERVRAPTERFYARRPPYSLRILSKPYLERYELRVFAQYDGRKGSVVKHMSKFIDTLGPYVIDKDLCLREFSKSLCDRAYTRYIDLKLESIPTQDDMVDVFCTRYFHEEKIVTLATL